MKPELNTLLLLEKKEARIAELEAENARLREALNGLLRFRCWEIAEGGTPPPNLERVWIDAESALADHFRDAAKMVSDGWLHIATAPKDGTCIIIGHPEWRRSADGYWSDDFREWRTSGIPPSPQPTHWQPLPILPNTAGGKEEA